MNYPDAGGAMRYRLALVVALVLLILLVGSRVLLTQLQLLPTESSVPESTTAPRGSIVEPPPVVSVERSGNNSSFHNPAAILNELDNKSPDATLEGPNTPPEAPVSATPPTRDRGQINYDNTPRLVMLILMSVAILAVGLFVILAKNSGKARKHWAYGIVGLVVGFWLI
jgi:hypothetical protein